MNDRPGFRLSPQQRRLWERHGEAQIGEYRSSVSARVDTADGADVLIDNLRRVAGRFEILRTRVGPVEGRAAGAQRIDAEPALALGSCEAERFDEVVAAMDVEPWSLVDGATLRGIVAPVDGGVRVWLCAPSVITDATGLVSWLASAIGALEHDEDVPQYADVAEWLIEVLEEADAVEPVARWERWVEQAPAQPRLAPVGRRRAHGVRFVELSRQLPPAVLPGESHALAAWQYVVALAGAQPNFSMGLRLEGRHYEEIAAIPGAFAVRVPVVAEVDPAQSLAWHAARVDSALREITEIQEYYEPQDDEWTVGWAQTGGAGLGELEQIQIESQRTVLDRTAVEARVERGTASDRLVIRFDLEAIDVPIANAWLEAWATVLEAAAADPALSLARVPLVAEERARTLVEQLGAGPSCPAPQRAVLDQIHDVAQARPEAVAVAAGDQSLGYGELWRRAGALAVRLRESGVRANDRVGLYCGRTVHAIVGIVGILRAGAGYVPVDPANPAGRVQAVLRDCGATAVVVEPGRTTGATVAPEVSVPDSEVSAAEAGPVDEPGELAYVLYTSGSTGKPKGVQVSRENLAWSTAARTTYYPAAPDCYFLLSSFSFDSSVAGIFWTLTTGGRLLLPDEDDLGDIARAAGLIARHGVSHVLALPSWYRLLVEHSSPEQLETLRACIVAGEACTPNVVQMHQQRIPQAALYNEYGPTEATVWATVHRCGDEDADASVPIGRPIPAARILVTDGRLLPLGIPGELWICGPGVTHGYLDQPALTAERFVDNPWGDGVYSRAYRTGDRVCMRGDGALVFLGRTDAQVKIRGFRIELGEIEAVLSSHPAVAEVVAVAHDGSGTHRRLVAYVEAVGAAPETADLAAHIERLLPSYMVPSQFVMVDAFPRTRTGKVDRNNLPDPDRAAKQSDRVFEAPRTAVERAIAAVWADTLGVQRVSLHDDFFALGGQSILATHAIARISRELGAQLRLRALFQTPTVAGLAAHAEAILIGSGADNVDGDREKIEI